MPARTSDRSRSGRTSPTTAREGRSARSRCGAVLVGPEPRAAVVRPAAWPEGWVPRLGSEGRQGTRRRVRASRHSRSPWRPRRRRHDRWTCSTGPGETLVYWPGGSRRASSPPARECRTGQPAVRWEWRSARRWRGWRWPGARTRTCSGDGVVARKSDCRPVGVGPGRLKGRGASGSDRCGRTSAIRHHLARPADLGALGRRGSCRPSPRGTKRGGPPS